MSLVPDQLDPVSRSFVACVAAHRPDWLDRVRPQARETPGEGFVEIEFAPPRGSNSETPLVVSTDGEEVTIYFGPHHTHIAAPDSDDSAGWTDVLDQIEAVLSERTAVVSVWSGDRMRVSFFEQAANLPHLVDAAQGDHGLRIQSWRGTHDRALPVRWPGVLKALSLRKPT